jgi:hypothetical protein
MRWLSYWAVVIAGAALSAPACLTSQEDAGGSTRPEDPPANGGSGGSAGTSRGGTVGEGGEATGGTGRGGSAGTAGTGNGEGGSDGGCVDDGDCAFRIDNRSICSAPSGECVDCLTVADCGSNEECIDNECRSIAQCSTSQDCPLGLVCNPSTDRCVQCIGSGDCTAGEVCAQNVCRTLCTADAHCSLFGLVCDRSNGYCVSCVDNSDCPALRNCQGGTCVRDICVEGSGTCESGGPSTCTAGGSMFTTPTVCSAQQTCTVDRTGARCQPWNCLPNTEGCALTSEQLVTCAANGIDFDVVDDCAAVNQLCIGSTGGMCADAICEPNENFCMGNTVQLCNSLGTAGTLVQTCATNQFCNPATATCQAQLCTPNMPACDMNFFTTCNATGDDYTGTGTDCTMLGQFCTPTGCATSMVDTFPSVPTLYSGGALTNYTMLNFFSVTSGRTLSRIEQYMNPAMATTLTWHVYESTTQTGTYTSISNTMTTSTTGEGYQASAALAVPLVAGRFYAIGLSWTTPATGFGYQQTNPAQTVSFGTVVSAYISTSAPTTTLAYSSTTSFWFPQRLTTAP